MKKNFQLLLDPRTLSDIWSLDTENIFHEQRSTFQLLHIKDVRKKRLIFQNRSRHLMKKN